MNLRLVALGLSTALVLASMIGDDMRARSLHHDVPAVTSIHVRPEDTP